MKLILNPELIEMAKSYLQNEDIISLAERCEIAVAAMNSIVKGKKKTTPEIVDAIQKTICVKHKQAGKVLKPYCEKA